MHRMNYDQLINIKFGGGTYMINLKRIGVSLLALTLAVSASMLGQLYSSTFAANTLPGDNEVITIGGTTDGQPVNATTLAQAYSSDGNIVLFTSSATNLPDAGGSGGLYIYNIKTDTTARVDISTNGTTPNGNLFNVGAGSSIAKMSETGRYVTFGSMATNLVDGSTYNPKTIYKRDTQAGVTSMVSSGYAGALYGERDFNLGMTNDGQFTLLASQRRNNSYPYDYKIQLGEDSGGTYSWEQVGFSSGSGYNDATTGGISCDGAFATYKHQYDIILIDLRKGNVTTLTAGNATSTSPIISCNGRYVLYATTNRTDITPTPTGMDAYLHLVRYDRITGERVYVDSNSSGTFSTTQLQYNPTYYDQQPNVFNASITDMGDVVFKYNSNTYLKHLSDESGTLESIAKTASGTYINVTNGTITSDGRYIFFKADPYDLGLAPSPSGIQLIRTKTGL